MDVHGFQCALVMIFIHRSVRSEKWYEWYLGGRRAVAVVAVGDGRGGGGGGGTWGGAACGGGNGITPI